MDRPSSLSSLKLYLATVLALLVCGVVASGQSIGNYEKEKGQTMLDQVESDIARHYYDANYHGVDLKAVFKEASEKLKKAQSNGQIMGIIAQATLSLEDSHTFFLPPEHQNLTDYGWEMQVVGDDVYVSKVKDKSDAQAKGLKVGDLVHQVGNYQPVRSNLWKLVYLYYALRPQPGMQVLVSSPGAEDREVDVIAKVKERPRIELTDQVDIRHLMWESEDEDITRRQSHRTRELGDVIIWKMPEFNLTADEVDGLMDKIRSHKVLILDLRQNPGGAEETLLRVISNLFNHDVKIGFTQRRTESKPLVAKTRADKAFTGQLIVLVDAGSASSAEILARVIQLEKRGTVVGDRTAGAVMRARIYPHEVGVTAVTFFAVSVTEADLKLSDGKSLEGSGVLPDELRLPTGADLFAKRDPVLSYAAKLAGVTIDAEKAGALFPERKTKL